MPDLLDNILTALPHDVAKLMRNRGGNQGFLQMAMTILFLPILTIAWRRMIPMLRWKVNDLLFPTAHINANDEAAEWIMSWMAQDPHAQHQMHHFCLSAAEAQATKRSRNSLVSKVNEKNASWASGRVVGKISPIVGEANNLHQVPRSMDRDQERTYQRDVVQTRALQKNLLKDFLVAAHDSVHAREERTVHIVNPSVGSVTVCWSSPVPRPSRPWSSVILPGTLKEDLLEDMETFFSAEEVKWYSDRGILHRRGYLLHGTPGAGKTTLTTALAGKLELDIYAIDPGQVGLMSAFGMGDAKTTTQLNKLFRSVPRRSIILVEDIDCIFAKSAAPRPRPEDTGSKEEPTDPDALPLETLTLGVTKKKASSKPKVEDGPSTVSLAGLLNAIDGVASQEGCIIIASTNHIEYLDPALYRPGRFDVKIHFDNATPEQARALFLHFFPLADILRMANQPKPRQALQSTGEPEANPVTTTTAPPITNQQELETVADAFVDNLFQTAKDHRDPGMSMAALQGYLLRYKKDPVLAAERVIDWVKSDAAHGWTRGGASSLVMMRSEVDNATKPNGKRSTLKAR